MATTLVDTNILFDYLNKDSEWFEWSAAMMAEAAETGTLAINAIIYAEISVRYDRMDDLDNALPSDDFIRAPLPWEAAFLAAKAFERYRRHGGTRRSSLPDFFIGAHAAVTGMTLLTRDARRYRTYFPKLRIMAP